MTKEKQDKNVLDAKTNVDVIVLHIVLKGGNGHTVHRHACFTSHYHFLCFKVLLFCCSVSLSTVVDSAGF